MSHQPYVLLAGAVHLLREQDGKTQILLARRCGNITGAGMWEFAGAGHIEQGESILRGTQREAQEELGITFDEKDIIFTTSNYQHSNGFRYHHHYFIKKWKGTPSIGEPDKRDKLEWFDLDKIPSELFSDTKQAIENFINNTSHSEYGF